MKEVIKIQMETKEFRILVDSPKDTSLILDYIIGRAKEFFPSKVDVCKLITVFDDVLKNYQPGSGWGADVTWDSGYSFMWEIPFGIDRGPNALILCVSFHKTIGVPCKQILY